MNSTFCYFSLLDHITFPGPMEPGNCQPMWVTVSITEHARQVVAFCSWSKKALSIGVSKTSFCLFTNEGLVAPLESGALQKPWQITFLIFEEARRSFISS